MTDLLKKISLGTNFVITMKALIFGFKRRIELVSGALPFLPRVSESNSKKSLRFN